MRFIKLFLLSAFCFQLSHAEVKVANIFSDGMVLQRGHQIPVWGTGSQGEVVTVTLDGKMISTQVDANGRWKVYLPKHKAGGPYVLQVNEHQVRDVLVGDVFLCSGQSNMELPVRRCMDKVAGEVKDYSNTQLRYVKIPHQFNYIAPNADLRTNGWQAATPQNIPEMGAVSFFAGRYVQEAENVPVGIINSSVGGTGVECWMSRDTLLHHKDWVAVMQDKKFNQVNWVDSVRQAEAQRHVEWERSMLQDDPIKSSGFAQTYDFSSWQPVDIFSRWATGEQGKIYGSYWFHNEFTIPALPAADKTYTIRLGAMKDADSVFVNGHFVGWTSYEYPPRIYKVPSRYLRQGRNDVVIKLMAQGGYPNFTSGKLYQFELDDQIIPLDKGWRMKRGTEMAAKPGSTYFVNAATALYNAMIAPLQDFPIAGAVWYQGENNTGMKREQYSALLESAMRCWRNQFHADFPVVVVQLAGYMGTHTEPLQQSGWCDIRLAQGDVARQLPKAALATAIDLGESNDIHPQAKAEMGRRVALQWRRLIYGEKLVAEGPSPLKATVKNDAVILKFDKKSGRLAPKLADGLIHGFTICGTDNRYVWTTATVLNDYTLRVAIPEGLSPIAVRYAYDEFPSQLSIYNTEGLPAPEFQISITR